MKKISIKFTVISLFTFFGIFIITIMLYIQYIFSQELVKSAMNEQINVLSSKVKDNIFYMNKNNSNLINSVSDFLEYRNYQDFKKNENKNIKLFTNILSNNPNIYAVYVGFEENSFFEVINLNIDNNLKKTYNAKSDDLWLVIEINDGIKTLSLLDKALEVTSIKTVVNDYNVVSRPWYKLALLKNHLIKTDPYDFSNITAKGITYSKVIKNTKNVFSLDILIKDLNNILYTFSGKTLENSFLINYKGEIIADSSRKKNQKVFEHIIKVVKKSKNQKDILNTIVINNKKYIYSIVIIDDEYLCSYAEESQIIKPYKEKFKYLFIVTALILVMILPLIFYLSSIIVKPILLLVDESKKVKNRRFDDVVDIKTKVLEISNLSNSLTEMSKSIDEYQKDLETKVELRTIELDEKNKELERLAVIDKLSGLYNRLKLDETIEMEIERTNRYNTFFGIIIIDIDYFKKVNDEYGHLIGDYIIKEFGYILQNNIRKIDTVGRWGGEEFMIVCPEVDDKKIKLIAEKIRLKIQQYNFKEIQKKTASFGTTIYKKGEKFEEIISRADQALYLAKEKGRNKVVLL